ncbi:hypothetical protein [Thalassospira marina]|uniref:Phage protein n=1 Tax=Thalassospira marina TaxID=2048283 RepID=A0ABN5FRK5_9PROT|nr:hypothetical protein [Thalassospira marina]AUG54294.1 hypothetical protein CSC3H3_17390 [Thalassospira marina]
MKMSKSEFGKMLEKKLNETHDLVILSRWAFEIFMDHQRDSEADDDMQELLLELSSMEDGEEFEFSVEELVALSKNLQNS